MKFKIKILNRILIYINKTALYLAVEKENIEIINLLLNNDKVDVNILNIFNQVFEYYLKLNISIRFKINFFSITLKIKFFDII